ncbi:thiamine monophosphate synthase [Burkholderia ambifaria IOP40-10]|uniref:Thiamine monophosphate synthase n=1 Tax=Burkholderia ambifaria IOP40-10 TaxID=396596 RepID=B1FQF6_9BURK|nr:thiamine monophosphate synthase [Burkholderia ambifaria IOP40-10]
MSARFADAFWPPADELAEAAERIRARLGDWPAGTTPWRLCVAAPDVPVDGDVLIVSAGDRAAQARASAASRPAAPDAVAIEFDEHGATLHAAGVRHALEAAHPPADDWIAALAAFLDCGFAPIDALVLALAWRDGDETRGVDAWPVDAARFPRVAGLAAAAEPAFPPCPAQLGLYPVVPDAEWVERVLDCGARTVQLRVKDADPAALRREIARAVAAGRGYPDARVFINDHWQIAVEEGRTAYIWVRKTWGRPIWPRSRAPACGSGCRATAITKCCGRCTSVRAISRSAPCTRPRPRRLRRRRRDSRGSPAMRVSQGRGRRSSQSAAWASTRCLTCSRRASAASRSSVR